MSTYYKASGKFSPLAFLFFLLVALIVLPILAAIYTYAIWYIPFPYINFFITIGFGFGVAIAISKLVIRWGKVRSFWLAVGFGVLGAFLALYYSWAIWIDLVFNMGESYGSDRIGITVSNIKIFQVFSLVMQPGALWNIMGEIKELGTWGIRGNAVNGTPLLIIWIIEALIVFVVTFISAPHQADEPFCEVNNKWFEEKILPAYAYLGDVSNIASGLESGNEELFNDLTLAKAGDTDSHSVFTLYANETNENYLSIENKLASLNDKNEVKFDSSYVVRTISISEAMSNKLEGIQNKPMDIPGEEES